MEILMLIVTVVLAIAIFAIAGIWILRESKERERKLEQTRAQARASQAAKHIAIPTASAPGAWDGGVKTSPRHLR